MGNIRVLAVCVVICFVLGMVLAATVSAADKKDVSAVIGMVDVEQVLAGYEKKKQRDAEVQAMINALQAKFDLRNRNRLLSEAELNELETLMAKEKPTEQEKARIAELDNLGKAKDNELKDLQNKKEQTEAEKARMVELQEQSRKADENLEKLARQYAADVEKKRTDLGNEITKDVLEAVKAVAQEKGIGTVIDKIAVLYGGEDITTQVLERLNKKK